MRSWVALSILLVFAGLSIFAYKVFVLEYPLRSAGVAGTWRAEIVVHVTGDGNKRVVVDALLPRASGYQRLLSEVVRSGPLRFSISEDGQSRQGRWSGALERSTSVSYQVSFDALEYRWELPASEERTADGYPKTVRAFLESSPGVQLDDPAVAQLAAELELDSPDRVVLVREIFAFVNREIGSMQTVGPMDAVSVIREGRGNAMGRARLFCALARHSGLPCVVVPGLFLEDGTYDSLHYWNEVYIGAGWVPVDTVQGLIERIPANRMALSTSAFVAPVQAENTASLSYRFEVESELAAFVDVMRRRLSESTNLVDRVSLLFLPLHVQQMLRLLLLVPLGALAISILRSIVGLRTFGTFMPMLIALSLTATGVVWGTAFLIVVVLLALLSRLWIKRFYLLLVARVAFILTMVIILMVGMLMVGDYMQIPTSGVGAFPFVIMTMIVERISVSLEEEGWRNTLSRIGTTLLSVYLTYMVVQARSLQTFLLVYPEFLIVILGLLIAVGKYTGYRLTELIRFRELAAPKAV